MAIAKNSLSILLSTLHASLTSASISAPAPATLLPSPSGIKLLDIKNDLFLSYLQNLTFLIILKIRHQKRPSSSSDTPATNGTSTKDVSSLDEAVVKKLVELRVYLEKGVKPLEARLKYQIDKVLLAASDADTRKHIVELPKTNGAKDFDSGSESEDDERDGVEVSKEEEEADMAYAPQARSFTTTLAAENDRESRGRGDSDGVYRPPRINAVAMPTTTGKVEKENKRANKSRTLEEFVSTELSTAPIAEPSIGSNAVPGGRRAKSEREKADEKERKEYEERNYVRLPKESKKERRKKGGRQEVGYGGEEWRGLGEGVERIERLTKRKAGAGVLEKSRKRAVEGGEGGQEVGQGFAKRVKMLSTPRKRGIKK